MSFLGVKRPDQPKKQSVTWDSQSISAKTTTLVTCDGRIDWNGTVCPKAIRQATVLSSWSLKGDNWMPWKRRMLAILRDTGLEKYIEKGAALPLPADPSKPTEDEIRDP